MIVTGTFENIIIESPLMKQLSGKSKEWILSHISEDTYFYQLVLRTAEGFSFSNTLKFLFDSMPLGFSLNYIYDLFSNGHCLSVTTFRDQDVYDVSIVLGDTDGDGRVSIIDATYIQRRLANLPVPDSFNEKAGRVNSDETLEITSATFIQRWLASIPVPYHIGESVI